MAENLKVTHYRNGDPILTVTDAYKWKKLKYGAYCNYDNNDSNADTYGCLYNWYAVDDSRNIAPEGWHVPTNEEWKELEIDIGMSQSQAESTRWRGTDEGDKLKSTNGWNNGGNGTEDYGFSALPGGFRSINGLYNRMGYNAYFWSAFEDNSSNAWDRYLYYGSSDVGRDNYDKRYGFSVRCVRD